MADTVVQFAAPPGLTLTLDLYASAVGSDTRVNGSGDGCTEATNAKGWYTATVTEALAGTYRVVLRVGANVIGGGWVDLVNDTGTYRVRGEYEVASGSSTTTSAVDAVVLDASPGLTSFGISGSGVSAGVSRVGQVLVVVEEASPLFGLMRRIDSWAEVGGVLVVGFDQAWPVALSNGDAVRIGGLIR